MSLIRPIPFEDFGGTGETLHFAHANGYPPATYKPILERLSGQFHVVAMRMRPLWPGTDPKEITNWKPLADDMARFFDEREMTNVLACGHSMGATTSLRLALDKPELFRALALIDPVLLPPYMSLIANCAYTLGVSDSLNPLARNANKRRETFESRSAMFENYRRKSVFGRMNDASLAAYVNAQACENSNGSVGLCYPAKWEARIYITGSRADLPLWRKLPELKKPLLIIRGIESNAFGGTSLRLFKHRLPSVKILTIPDASHLVPLEYPLQVTDALTDFFMHTS